MGDTIGTHLTALARERHPRTAPIALRDTARYLSQHFSAAGLDVTEHRFEAWGESYENVIGTTPASADQMAAPLILAAHYDTVEGSPGADDNASGLVVLIEVARRITGIKLIRPVRFIAFCLEEENLLGSRAYVSHLLATRQVVHGAIVLECVGCASDREGTQQIPPGIPVAVPTVGNFLAVIGNQQSAPLTTRLTEAMRHSVPVIPLVVPGNGELLPDTRRSDHTAFWEGGFPAIMITDTANFRNPHYHRPTDTIESVNLAFLSSVADAVTAGVLACTSTQGMS
ncbi:MAG: M28 family peptidase [Nitrospira sp.]